MAMTKFTDYYPVYLHKINFKRKGMGRDEETVKRCLWERQLGILGEQRS